MQLVANLIDTAAVPCPTQHASLPPLTPSPSPESGVASGPRIPAHQDKQTQEDRIKTPLLTAKKASPQVSQRHLISMSELSSYIGEGDASTLVAGLSSLDVGLLYMPVNGSGQAADIQVKMNALDAAIRKQDETIDLAKQLRQLVISTLTRRDINVDEDQRR